MSRCMISSRNVALAAAVTLALAVPVDGSSQAAPTTDASSTAVRVFEAFDRHDWATFIEHVSPMDLVAFREIWEPVVRQVERRSPVPAVFEGSGANAERAFVRHFMNTYTAPSSVTAETFMRHRVIGVLEPDVNTAYVVYERLGGSKDGSTTVMQILPLIAERGEWRIRLTDDLMRVNELLCMHHPPESAVR